MPYTTDKLKLVLGGAIALGGAATVLLIMSMSGGATPAAGQQTTVGNLQFTAGGNFRPRRLPRQRLAPIRLVNVHGGIRNLDANGNPIPVPFPEPNPRQPVQAPAPEGSRPPIASRVILDFDRRGTVFTRGLPRCRPAQVRNQTHAVALNRCRNALLAEGRANAVVDFPDQDPFVAPGNLLMFNGPPRGGNPTVVIHVWANPDVPTAFVMVARVRPNAPGKRFRHRVVVNVPRVANDNGAMTDFEIPRIARQWRHRGQRRSYLRARCNKPRRLAVRARVVFRPDEAFPQAHQPVVMRFNRPCRVRR